MSKKFKRKSKKYLIKRVQNLQKESASKAKIEAQNIEILKQTLNELQITTKQKNVEIDILGRNFYANGGKLSNGYYEFI